ncbi:MAG: hypothetical protein R3C68_18370 [Myxococcota bacterium]
MAEAGADALELNVYTLGANPLETAADLELTLVQMVCDVVESVGLPVAVKISPFFTSLANFVQQLDDNGASALVLFNRFYQPDIDVDELEVTHALNLSTSSDLLLRLRWLAILFGRLSCGLAVTGGVHTTIDVVKATMCGADVVQMVSALLKGGPSHLRDLRTDLVQWLETHEYESLAQMRGSMSLKRCPNPKAYERANYAQLLQSWRGQPFDG